MVYYRKYRPQTIDELDSQKVRETLYSVLSSQTVSHAFLFTGPKGLGKTSTARIVAKVVNCERLGNQRLASSSKEKKLSVNNYTLNASIEPCGKCEQCISVTSGTNLDVMEIDGASNRGIDEMRDLREKVRLSPVSARKKVYIIDEVHMLTTEAFNALLKTLEEPPDHVLFILCTTQPHKVPETIISRCFHISFRTATEEELVRSFTRIVKGEKLNVSGDVLYEIAKLSDGGFRDGTKVLEELVSLSDGRKITKELLETKYHIISITYFISQLLQSLSQKNIKLGLELIGKMEDQGIDMKYFVEKLIAKLHELLLKEAGVTQNSSLNLEFTIDEITQLVGLLSKAYGELKFAVIPQLPLELAVIEWGEEKLKIKNEKSNVKEDDTKGAHVISNDSEKSQKGYRDLSFSTRDDKGKSGQATRVQEGDLLFRFIEKVKTQNHILAGVLRGCKIVQQDDTSVTIMAGGTFHKERLEEKKTMELLEKIGSEIIGRKIAVEIILKE